MTQLRSPLQAQLVQWLVAPGDTVAAGELVVVLEAMKMEHELRAEVPGLVREFLFVPGEGQRRGPADGLRSVLFAEGRGGRPGDTDMPIVAGLHVPTFASFARLNGQVPVIGVAAGRCFAGNAALLGCCDTIIATANSNIGMGGPAMVEGGGLGVFQSEEIGPSATQHANGVIDILVEGEEQAVAAAQHDLGFFQGSVDAFAAPDALALRDLVPENRLRVYDTRKAMDGIADIGSLLDLRSGFGAGIAFGGMGLEGTVKLGYRKELEAQHEGPAREELYRQLVAKQYESGQAMNMAATLEIDAVIDPAATREWLARGLAGAKQRPPAGGLRIDTW